MGSSANQDYCAFTKAVEHLGDKWSLLILRELLLFGPQGFNQLAEGLPGMISRSVLAMRLRKLEQLELIARDPTVSPRHAPYRLAPAGQQLVPTLTALWRWAEKWVPKDPGLAHRDPAVILWWLTQRVDNLRLPLRQVVLDLAIFDTQAQHAWLVMTRGAEPTLCVEDPLLDPGRYVFVEANAAGLLPIARGQRGWMDAIADGSVRVFGNPELVRDMPGWFHASQASLKPAQDPPAPVAVG